jgi:D-alanine-D-alanine ligase-like ATP-grasp enzyme
MPKPSLILVYEPESACRARLAEEGFSGKHALEVSSYLAQSTDLAPEFTAIEKACADRGLGFLPLPLDDAVAGLAGRPAASTLVWTLTDGIAYFRGGAAPALARLNGLPTIGADDSLFALCQDKFRSGAVLSALGLPVPPAGLARDGEWLIEPPASRASDPKVGTGFGNNPMLRGENRGWFVKPNRLGAKIGIWADSHCDTPGKALNLSRRVFDAYRDAVVVQPYVPGRNVRASFLAVRPDVGPEALGVFFVDSGGDFQTMDDSLALYGETGADAVAEGRYIEPELIAVADNQPEAAAKIRAIAARLMKALGLRDVFSMDFRVEADDTVHLIEFEVAPGLPCFDFRAYCRSQWGLTLAEAMAETAANRFSARPD